MKKISGPKSVLLNLMLLAISALFALVVGEIFARLWFGQPLRGTSGPPLHLPCGTCPYLYELNPERPGISSQGLRGRDYGVPKPRGRYRILFIGDSVVFGSEVPNDATFVHILERTLNEENVAVDVINAGVQGYTTYNQLYYYLDRGRLFEPDLVLVGFSMNDVVDPLPHWHGAGQVQINIPEGAIPNPQYHQRKIVPRFRADARSRLWRERSYLYRSLDRVLLRRLGWGQSEPPADRTAWVEVGGRKWPTYLTLEDDLSIEVLMDYESPEWRWLRRLYSRLRDAVVADGSELAVVVFPLAYQLDHGYPFIPQGLWNRFCAEEQLACLDMLPSLRRFQKEQVFQLEKSGGYYDVWHLSKNGHRIVSRELERFLRANYLQTAGDSMAFLPSRSGAYLDSQEAGRRRP